MNKDSDSDPKIQDNFEIFDVLVKKGYTNYERNKALVLKGLDLDQVDKELAYEKKADEIKDKDRRKIMIELFENGMTDFEKNKAVVCDGAEVLDLLSYQYMIECS